MRYFIEVCHKIEHKNFHIRISKDSKHFCHPNARQFKEIHWPNKCHGQAASRPLVQN